MSAILYIAGFLIGIAVFLYLYNAYQGGREKVKKIAGKGAPRPAALNESAKISAPAPPLTRTPGSRTCPLCGSTLTRTEPLYGVKVVDGKQEKILIYGCPYCYKDEPRKK